MNLETTKDAENETRRGKNENVITNRALNRGRRKSEDQLRVTDKSILTPSRTQEIVQVRARREAERIVRFRFRVVKLWQLLSFVVPHFNHYYLVWIRICDDSERVYGTVTALVLWVQFDSATI